MRIIGLFLLLLLPGCREIRNDCHRYVAAAHDLWGFEGAVLVAVKGEVFYSEAFGMADHLVPTPNTLRTRFFIGSITKQFTAAAILKLKEKGLLKLSDPISKYLPDYPKDAASRITIEQLLTHTSGIPDYTADPEILLRRISNLTPEEIIASFENKPLDFEPGTDFRYSNSGYILLGKIIECVAGQSYEAFLHHEFLNPLGMHNSGYGRREAAVPNRATGYTLIEDGSQVQAIQVHFSILHSAGALYSTVKDMLLWDQALTNGTVLNKKSVDVMQTPHGHHYGYGVFVETLYGRKHVFHGGFLDGFNTTFDRWPNQKLCVVVFSNEDEAPVKKMARGLAAIVFHEPYEMPVLKQPIAMPADSLSVYEGVYELARGLYRVVYLEQGMLKSYLGGNPPQRLLPQARDTFFLSTDNTVTFSFHRGNEDGIKRLDITEEGRTISAARLDSTAAETILDRNTAIALDPAVYKQYVGRYLLESNTFTDEGLILTVTLDDNRLLVKAFNFPPFEILPRTEYEFFHKTADFRLIFRKNEAGEVTGCIVRMGGEEITGKRIQ